MVKSPAMLQSVDEPQAEARPSGSEGAADARANRRQEGRQSPLGRRIDPRTAGSRAKGRVGALGEGET